VWGRWLSLALSLPRAGQAPQRRLGSKVPGPARARADSGTALQPRRRFRTRFAGTGVGKHAAITDAAHNATLDNMCMIFADVRPTAEVLGVIKAM